MGSGKTTVLLELIKYISKSLPDDCGTKAAIIENEIGEISVDGAAVAMHGLTVRNISNGCICCTLSSDLVSGVVDIRNKINPKWLIIEATGLALPEKISKQIADYVSDAALMTVVIVDAKRFDEFYDILRPLVTGQLAGAQKILLNKAELVTDPALAGTVGLLEELNPAAEIMPISAAEGIEEDVFRRIFG